MKKVILSFILVLTTTIAFTQSVDEIIQLHIKAIGGEKAWLAINTIEINSVTNNDGSILESTKRIEKNKNYKLDIHYLDRLSGTESKKNDNHYYILISENGAWKYLPENLNHSVYTMNSNEIEYYKDEFDFLDPFINYQQKNSTINMMPIEYINNEEYYKFRIKYNTGKEEFIYINTKTNLIYKRILINSEIESWSEIAEYQILPNGIIFPKHIQTNIGKTTIESVKINPIFDKSIFKIPFSSVDNKLDSIMNF